MQLTDQITNRPRNPRTTSKKDLRYAMRVTRVIFHIVGVWPLPGESPKIKKLLQKVQNVICYFLFLFILLPGILCMLLKPSGLHMKLKTIGAVLSVLFIFLKYNILLWKPSQIRKVVESMDEDWLNASNSEDRKILLSKATLGRKFVTFMVAFMYSASIPFCIVVPLSKGRILLPNNTTMRALPCPSYFVIFDEQVTPIYELVFTLQVIGCVFSCSGVCGPCSLATYFVLHVCGQLRILINRIDAITSGEGLTEDIIRQRVAVILEHQIKVKKFLKEIQDILEGLCFVDILGSTLIVCFTGFYVIADWEHRDTSSMMTYILFVVTFGLTIFLWCFVGQLLLNEGEDVYQSYKIVDWYQLPPKQARDLVIIIAMSSTPLKITAYKMKDMSLASFADIMKTSIAYLNFLRTIT